MQQPPIETLPHKRMDALQERVKKLEEQQDDGERRRRASWMNLRQGLLLIVRFIERAYEVGKK